MIDLFLGQFFQFFKKLNGLLEYNCVVSNFAKEKTDYDLFVVNSFIRFVFLNEQFF